MISWKRYSNIHVYSPILNEGANGNLSVIVHYQLLQQVHQLRYVDLNFLVSIKIGCCVHVYTSSTEEVDPPPPPPPPMES